MKQTTAWKLRWCETREVIMNLYRINITSTQPYFQTTISAVHCIQLILCSTYCKQYKAEHRLKTRLPSTSRPAILPHTGGNLFTANILIFSTVCVLLSFILQLHRLQQWQWRKECLWHGAWLHLAALLLTAHKDLFSINLQKLKVWKVQWRKLSITNVANQVLPQITIHSKR